MDHVQGPCLQKRFKGLSQVHILPGSNWRRGGMLQLPVLVCQVPGQHILQPGKMISLKPPGNLYHVRKRKMPKMVNGQGNLGPNHASDPSDIFIQLIQALFRHMHVGKGMGNPVKIIQQRIGRRTFSPCAGPCDLTHLFLHRPQFIYPVQGTAGIPFLGHQELHTEYFDHGKALVHISLQDTAHLLRLHQYAGGPSLFNMGIRIKPYLFPEPSSQ